MKPARGPFARLFGIVAQTFGALTFSALAFCPAFAQSPATVPVDAGILNQMQGSAVLLELGKEIVPAQPFMKLRHGDTLRLPAGARAGIVYFSNGRQEIWKGPVDIRVESAQGIGNQGTPEVTQIMVDVSQRLERTAMLARIVREGRPGSVSVRSIAANAEIRAARERHDLMRSTAGMDDLTPDMYLFTVLESHRRFDEMKALLLAMQSRRPDDPFLREMDVWLEKQAR